MTEAERWKQLKANPIKYASFLERKRKERKCRQMLNSYETKRRRKWNENNPEIARMHRKAQNSVRYAVKRGLLERPEACSKCGKIGPVQGHHTDYARELDVEWLCQLCHTARHYPRLPEQMLFVGSWTLEQCQ